MIKIEMMKKEMMKMRTIWILSLWVIGACSTPAEPIVISADDYHKSVDRVGQIMVHDIFSPPVASRVFAYPNIAAYEIMAKGNTKYVSLSNQLNALPETPDPEEVCPAKPTYCPG